MSFMQLELFDKSVKRSGRHKNIDLGIFIQYLQFQVETFFIVFHSPPLPLRPFLFWLSTSSRLPVWQKSCVAFDARSKTKSTCCRNSPACSMHSVETCLEREPASPGICALLTMPHYPEKICFSKNILLHVFVNRSVHATLLNLGELS